MIMNKNTYKLTKEARRLIEKKGGMPTTGASILPKVPVKIGKRDQFGRKLVPPKNPKSGRQIKTYGKTNSW